MVSNPSRRNLNLGRYSIVPSQAGDDLRVGSFWKRKQIDKETIDSFIDNTIEKDPKRFAGVTNVISPNCMTSSGRGSTDPVTPYSFASTSDHESESTNSYVTSNDKNIRNQNQDKCDDQVSHDLRVGGSETVSPILNVDTSTLKTRIGDTHESVVVELDPARFYLRSNEASQISESDIAITESSTVSKAPLQRKKIYPKKLDYEKILSGVNFVLSGYVNPRRSKLRDMAMAMGACYNQKSQRDTTHLICAFKNTLKHKEVMAVNGRVVREHWIQECSKQRQLLDWRDYKLGKYSYPDSEEEVRADDDGDDDSEQFSLSSRQ